jgi:hypothetical protein
MREGRFSVHYSKRTVPGQSCAVGARCLKPYLGGAGGAGTADEW